VVALELALTLPLVALLLVAGLGLVGVVRTALVAQEAARLGARIAAVDRDDGAVHRAVRSVVGADARITVSARTVHQPVRVTVDVPVEVAGVHRTVGAAAVALVEPIHRREGDP
jgi:hypothetical protein